ncbi:ferredoxin--NADP reductase [Flavobacterium aurantiibacter]|uniref:Flavodoxin reductase n=1 Tax=Flavobacterium aurantiibacter TaxID=2023067 RepID=A0A255ZVV8_9FLAO|nr:ferredoxin--NADP reductase [Flavobacterium aurantiibacter]OYQ45613.1 flavodoxin reductase [Flavobacterium aurantiibacter]
MSSFFKLHIKEVKRETDSCVSIVFTIPEPLQQHYQYVSGQYVNLKLTLDGQEIRRAYSICSSPNENELRIAVKAVKHGAFSNFANQQLKAGSVIEVSAPEGRFTVDAEKPAHNIAAFAAGSGITPVMSILKSVLASDPNGTFLLVYGNKSPQQTIFYQQLHDLQQQYVGRLLVQFVFSEAKQDGALFGRIDRSVVNYTLKNKYKDIAFESFFLCGPEGMINTVSGALKEANVPESKIKFELFSTSSSETDLKIADGHTTITVTVDDETSTFEMSRKQSVLDAALKHGLDAPYSCQGGICSSCLARITEGTAEMKKNTILTDGEIADGLILTCQAHPTSAVLKIDYDDV